MVKSRAACVTVVNAWALPQCPLEVLVTQVTFAVLVAVPANQKDRQDMAEFIRGLFMQGEIHFDDYITRMRNLFPQEMGALSNDLQGKIASRLRCN